MPDKTTWPAFRPALLENRDSARLQGYRRLLDFYGGEQWPAGGSARDKRLTFNYTRVVLDKITSYLAGGMHLKLSPAGGDSAAAEAAAKAGRGLR